MKNKNLLVITTYVGANLFVIIFTSAFLVLFPQLKNQINLVNTIASLLIGIMSSICFIIILRKYLTSHLKSFKENFKRNIVIILLGYVMLLVSLIIGQTILDLLGESGTSENQEMIESLMKSSSFTLVMMGFITIIFAPFTEEILFRKAIFGLTDSSLGTVVALLVSSFFFGFLHVMGFGDFIQVIPYALMGLTLGISYIISERNIFVPMFIHLMHNLIGFLIMILFVK